LNWRSAEYEALQLPLSKAGQDKSFELRLFDIKHSYDCGPSAVLLRLKMSAFAEIAKSLDALNIISKSCSSSQPQPAVDDPESVKFWGTLDNEVFSRLVICKYFFLGRPLQ
jgi:hypothetical protein